MGWTMVLVEEDAKTSNGPEALMTASQTLDEGSRWPENQIYTKSRDGPKYRIGESYEKDKQSYEKLRDVMGKRTVHPNSTPQQRANPIGKPLPDSCGKQVTGTVRTVAGHNDAWQVESGRPSLPRNTHYHVDRKCLDRMFVRKY